MAARTEPALPEVWRTRSSTMPTRFRIHMWANLKTRKHVYGIQVSTQPRKWMHSLYTHGGVTIPVIFEKLEDAKEALKAYRAGGGIDADKIYRP